MSLDDFHWFMAAALLLPALLSYASLAVLFAWPESLPANRSLGLAGVFVAAVLLVGSVWLVIGVEFDWFGDLGRALRSTNGWQHQFWFFLPRDLFTLDVHIDSLSLYFILLSNVVAFAAAWIAARLTEPGAFKSWQAGLKKGTTRLTYPAFFYFCFSGFYFSMLLVPILDNLIGLWIGVELTTLFSALVVGFRNTPAAWEAAWKYLVITSAGIVLALLGTMFLAHAIPEGANAPGAPDSLMNWTALMTAAHGGTLTTDFVELAFLFILIGYGTKAGLAPMHTWLPDGHGEAPPSISALLSGVLLKLALYAILRFYAITNVALGSTFLTSNLLLVMGLISLVVATPFILKRNRFKRVLAYHSVEHMGIICFGLGIGTPLALLGALLHSFNHAVTKALMFLAYGSVLKEYRKALGWKVAERDKDWQVTGVLRVMPRTAALLALGGFALVGTPPFGIFVSELMILWGAIQRLIPVGAATAPPVWPPGPPGWAVAIAVGLFILTTTLIFYGLVRHLLDEHLFGKVPERTDRKAWRGRERLGADLAPLLFLALLVSFGVFLLAGSDLLETSLAILNGKSTGPGVR